jgi:hypothetical protein
MKKPKETGHVVDSFTQDRGFYIRARYWSPLTLTGTMRDARLVSRSTAEEPKKENV